VRYSPSTLAFYPEDTDTVKYDKPDDLTHVTDDQYAEIISALKAGSHVGFENEQLVITPEDPHVVDVRKSALAWHIYKSQAKNALEKTSVTIERCFEAAIALPSDWVDYRKALRAILSQASGDPTVPLPAQPAYPNGT
jgi:hypothetical protein